MNKDKETPFKSSLENSGISQAIKFFVDRPDKFVREWGLPRYDIGKDITDEGREKRKEKVKHALANFLRGMNIFHKLESEYGIAVPKHEIVVGKNQYGVETIFTVVEKISGKNMSEPAVLTPDDASNGDDFFCGMIRSFKDVYKNGGDWWWDFYPRQIVYGHRSGEDINRLYIVDIEPRFETVKPLDKRVLAHLTQVRGWLYRIEQDCGVELNQARKELFNILKK